MTSFSSFIKANLSATPLEMYNFMYNHKLCESQPEFYVAWAWELEQVGNFKRAELVFQKASKKLAGGVDEEGHALVLRKQAQFQARVMKQVFSQSAEDSLAAGAGTETEEEEQRSALGALRAHGKRAAVGSVRVGGAKKNDGLPGTLPQMSSSASTGNNRPLGNSNSAKGKKPSFSIYQVKFAFTNTYILL